jgi:hypothetical protein
MSSEPASAVGVKNLLCETDLGHSIEIYDVHGAEKSVVDMHVPVAKIKAMYVCMRISAKYRKRFSMCKL